jgi:DNA-binding transcriptional ArsR family regulator
MTVAASQLDFSQMQDNAGKACGLLKAMANEARLMVLCQLIESEKSVTELQDAVGLSQSAMSQHLAVLRELDIVATRRDGQSVYYRIANADATALMETLHRRFCETPAPTRRR